MQFSYHIQQIIYQAIIAKKGLRLKETALLFEQAYQEAKKMHVSDLFALGIDSASCWNSVEEPLRALDRLLEITKEIPLSADPRCVFLSHLELFHLLFQHKPSKHTLSSRLGELDRLLPPSRQDECSLCHAKSVFHSEQDDCEGALEWIERAWVVWNKRDLVHRHTLAEWAASLCLSLNRLEKAREWHAILVECEDECLNFHYGEKNIQVDFALYTGNWKEAEEYSERMEQSGAGFQSPSVDRNSYFVRLRTYLMRDDGEDPQKWARPLRQFLSQRNQWRLPMAARYGLWLLIGDFRLATVRFAAGMKPAEDTWYKFPQSFESVRAPMKPGDFQRRVFRTRKAYAVAFRWAKALDTCFECNWRQEQVKKRGERLDEIVRSLSLRGQC